MMEEYSDKDNSEANNMEIIYNDHGNQIINADNLDVLLLCNI